jgi:hypothetical protein
MVVLLLFLMSVSRYHCLIIVQRVLCNMPLLDQSRSVLHLFLNRPVRRRYPDRSEGRSYSGNYDDPGSAFRNNPQSPNDASADAFPYDPYPPGQGQGQQQNREQLQQQNSQQRGRRPEQNYPRRNASLG